MDKVQNCDSYINIPSSQTYRSYSKFALILASVCHERKEWGNILILRVTVLLLLLIFEHGCQ
jgi:hypothetical protein